MEFHNNNTQQTLRPPSTTKETYTLWIPLVERYTSPTGKLFVGISQVHNIQDLYGDKYHPSPNKRLLEIAPIEATVSNVYRNAPKPLQK
jgi:hypothetical protein